MIKKIKITQAEIDSIVERELDNPNPDALEDFCHDYIDENNNN